MTEPVRDLTTEEREHAAFLARRWNRLCGYRSTFGLSCEELAKTGWLTRKQYDLLKVGPRLLPASHRKLIHQRRSTRPITLAGQ